MNYDSELRKPIVVLGGQAGLELPAFPAQTHSIHLLRKLFEDFRH